MAKKRRLSGLGNQANSLITDTPPIGVTAYLQSGKKYGGTISINRSSNTFSITNSSGNNFETQELMDIDALIASITADQLNELHVKKALYSIRINATIDGSLIVPEMIFFPAFVVISDGGTVATTESNDSALEAAQYAAITGEFGLTQMAEIVTKPGQPYYTGASTHFQVRGQRTYDIKNLINRCARRIVQNPLQDETPEAHIIGTMAARDDGTNWYVETTLLIEFELRPRTSDIRI